MALLERAVAFYTIGNKGFIMKKIYIMILWFLLAPIASVQATSVARIDVRVTSEILQAERQYAVLSLVQQGDVAALRKALPSVQKESLSQQDDYGNNVFHLAKKKEMFSFLWNLFPQEQREKLLMQRNKAGEIPMMMHIMYGEEDIFLQYFPKTHLYKQFQSVTADLQKKGLARQIAKTKQQELLRQTNVGPCTLWDRADALYKGTKVDTHYAPYREKMKKIMILLETVAPFLVSK